MDVIIISEAAGIRKPDTSIFQIALDQLAVAPEVTWYIGDHPHSDMQGAANAGITGVWVHSSGHQWSEDQPAPKYQIDALSELLYLLAD